MHFTLALDICLRFPIVFLPASVPIQILLVHPGLRKRFLSSTGHLDQVSLTLSLDSKPAVDGKLTHNHLQTHISI